MKKSILPVSVPRAALWATAPAALALASAGPALAAAGPAAAAGHSAASSVCTVTWVGRASQSLWTIAANWSTGKVPGPSDDVCITKTGVEVVTNASITVHSLRLGGHAGIALEGSAGSPLTATVATVLSAGTASGIDLTDASISAAKVNDQGGTILTNGTCRLSSPDVVFGAGGNVQAANGTTVLTSLPQLHNGTLTGASFSAGDAVVVLPGDITHLVSSNISVGVNSEIAGPSSSNALTGLTSIDSHSSLLLDSSLAVAGSLTADGNVTIDGGNLTVPGTFTQAQGNLSLLGQHQLSATRVTIGGAATAMLGGTIAGSLVNNGFVTGFGGQVTGDYAQASNASLDFGLAVAGRATLAGELLSGEGDPVPGDTSAAVTFGTLSGGFTSHGLGITLITKAHEIDTVITPQIAASPATVAAGHTVTVDGASFRLGSTVTVVLANVPGASSATARPHYFGRFAVTIAIPSSVKPGLYTLIALGSDGSRAQTQVRVS